MLNNRIDLKQLFKNVTFEGILEEKKEEVDSWLFKLMSEIWNLHTESEKGNKKWTDANLMEIYINYSKKYKKTIESIINEEKDNGE